MGRNKFSIRKEGITSKDQGDFYCLNCLENKDF